jgi:hypothetical protein
MSELPRMFSDSSTLQGGGCTVVPIFMSAVEAFFLFGGVGLNPH